VSLNNLAILARRSGDLPGARAQLLEGLALYRDLNLDLGQVEILEGLASVEVAQGNPSAALRLLTVTRRERGRLGSPSFGSNRRRDREQALADARTALGADADAVAEAAEHLPLHTVVDDLL
jgi:hypothetical protein